LIPKPLLDTIREKQCIPILGAGFSLNAKLDGGTMPTWVELTKKLAKELQIDEQDPLQVSQKFQDKSDRPTLIRTIEKLLYKDTVKPHHVHRHFVKIPYFDIICTTNYDNLLEDACKQEGRVARVIVEKQQISMYGGSQDLKILKIHGDLDHTQELIITQNDYSTYSEKKKEFEIFLLSLLMTKTPLFIGFSLQDPNFLQIKKKIDSMMGETIRKGYVILFDPNKEEITTYENMKLQVISINTNGKSKSECLLDLFKTINEQYIEKQLIPKQQVSEKYTTITVVANKTILFKNQTLKFRTLLGYTPKQPISVYIKNDDDEIIYNTDMNDAKIIREGLLEKELILNEEKWEVGKDYTIYAEWNKQKVSDSFTLATSPDIVAQTDKSVYIYGSDIILTGIVPQASIGSKINYKILNKSKNTVVEGIMFVETEDTGIFQTLIAIEGEKWKFRGEEFKVIVEYQDKSANLSIFTSNFGATLELDQKVYSWTDKVYITIAAPDFAQDPHKVDVIGNEENGLVTIKTTLGKITKYNLVETGENTGIFTGEITLSGFVGMGIENNSLRKYPFGITRGQGPTNGLLACLDDDAISVSFQFSDDEVVIGSALIRWNIGEIQWKEANYQIEDHATIRVIDPDMNLSPEEIDIFDIHIWSDSDKKGIKIPVYETGNAMGIFEGVVCFSKDASSNRGLLKVKMGDTVYAKYEDTTLPDPYTTKDKLELSATTKIISKNEKMFLPLERFTIQKLFITDLHGKILEKVEESQSIVIRTEITNNQQHEQQYIVLMQTEENGVVSESLTETGILNNAEKQEIGFILNPLHPGTYKATLFVWPSISFPDALCPPQILHIQVSNKS